jgi:hypothetical protein
MKRKREHFFKRKSKILPRKLAWKSTYFCSSAEGLLRYYAQGIASLKTVKDSLSLNE